MPDASVIVRVKDAEATLGRALSLIRTQTADLEIIVVDSGSRDSSRDIASALADVVIDLPPSRFSYGRALNTGASAARSPVHMAVSAHCMLPRTDWVARCLVHYENPLVAGTAGARWLPGGQQLTGVLLRDRAHTLAHPFWGFSNHASSWRAAVWERVGFDEDLAASEDQEWAWRVSQEGWVIAVDPELTVPASHRWTQGTVSYFRRTRREVQSIRSFLPLQYGARELVAEWWNEVPRESPRPAWAHRFFDYRRLAGLAGKYAGARGPIR